MNQIIIWNRISRQILELIQDKVHIVSGNDVSQVNDNFNRVSKVNASVDPRQAAVPFKLRPGVEGVLQVLGGRYTRLDLGRSLRKFDGHVEVVGPEKFPGGLRVRGANSS